MKDKYGITKTRTLTDFLPKLTIAVKNLATGMTNHNVRCRFRDLNRTALEKNCEILC